MSTPRTIKASEVVKGMRVRVEERFAHPPLVKGGVEDETIETIEGTVTVCANANITFADGNTRYLGYDHPVTVLADPEPEWVEGAWYRCQVGTNEPENLRRLPHGWTPFYDTERVFHLDDEDITVLGRVLVVDWPGDEHASKLVETYGAGLTWDDFECSPLQIIADAIRTQGGAR